MTYEEAKKLSLQVKWKVSFCSQGEKCWCEGINTVEPIVYNEGDSEEELCIIDTGQINKNLAEHIIRLHNDFIDGIQKIELNNIFYQPLFDHMAIKHGLVLTITEMDSIINLTQNILKQNEYGYNKAK